MSSTKGVASPSLYAILLQVGTEAQRVAGVDDAFGARLVSAKKDRRLRAPA
jgi:hypothetical protein